MTQETKNGIRILQPNESISQQTWEPQSILIREDTKLNQLILLHQGEIAYIEPKNKEYLCIVSTKNYIPGFCFIFTDQPIPYRVITTKASIISAFPVSNSKNPEDKILGKLNLGIIALNTLNKETSLFLSAHKKYIDFFNIVNNFVNILSICYYKLQSDIFNKNIDEIEDINLKSIKSIVERYLESNTLPKQISKSWLIQNQYIENFISELDIEDVSFEFSLLNNIMTLPLQIQTSMLKTQIKILELFSLKYLKLQIQILNNIIKYLQEIKKNLSLLLSGNNSLMDNYSIITDLLDSNELAITPKEFTDLLEYIKEKMEVLANHYSKVFLKKFIIPNQYSKIIAKYQQLNLSNKEQNQKKSNIQITSDKQGIIDELKNSSQKIMNFCEISNEEQKKMENSLSSLLKINNPLDSDPDIRRLKRPVHEIFWKAYEKAYFKYHNARGNVPRYIQLFLFYGYFDERFLEPQHLIEIYDLTDITDSLNPQYSTLNTIEWLNLIYTKKEIPSINDVGVTYFEYLKNQYPVELKEIKKLDQVPMDKDNPEKRVSYEIKNFIETNSKLVSGSPLSYLSVLTKYHITAPKISDLLLTKEKVSEALNKLLEIDFSAFYREMVLNDEKRKILKEFIMVNIYPHIILMPTAGNRSMMWQELEDPRKKDSRARFTFPILCSGDLFNLLIYSVGAFRWEIQRTILGHDYSNVGVPSLTSEYIDYIQFYHKNRDLSDEQKEKIKAGFKNYRDDRSKFIHDYLIWIKYESQGILKHNKVVRNILYRYIPFSKGIRENIAKQPAFAEIHNKFTNLRKRKLTEIENRWKKYGDMSTWPDSLKSTYEFYNS